MIDAIILGGVGLQAFGLYTEYGYGVAALVVGTEAVLIGLAALARFKR